MERGSRIAGRYTLVGPLGAGRGGQVWTADDARTGVRVAIKLRHDPIGPGADARTDVELSGLRELEHPHLVRILDAGIDAGGVAYVVSELVASGSLDHIPKPLAPAALDALAAQMLDALAYLHAHGILHADVKTENVFVSSLDPPQFKLGDFGFAHRRTGDGALRGSPAFLAPEVIRGEPADERSDLYALGILLYECAFGAVPFGDRDVRRVLKRQLTETPERLADPGDVNPRLVALLRRLLPKEPAERPSDARAALAAWRGDEAGLPTWVPPHLGVLIGRDAEMATLSQLLASGGGAVAIDGPPGIGKTRLLREFALRAELDGTHVEWWTPAVGTTSSNTARGAVVIIEDLDRSSPWSREAAANRIRDELIGARGSLVCVTGRGGAAELLTEALAAGQLPSSSIIELHPWPAADVHKACAGILGAHALDPSLAALVMDATAGIPAGVEGACRALVEQKLLVRAARGALAVPATETATRLAARISDLRTDSLLGLAPRELALLQTLAILDTPVSLQWLVAMHSSAATDIGRLVRNALVNPQSTPVGSAYVISDAAFRRAVLSKLEDRLRQKLHDRVAATFHAAGDTTTADYHRAQGSRLADAYAALNRYSTTDAALFAPDSTATLYERLLAVWPHNHDTASFHGTQIAFLDLVLRMGDLDRVLTAAHRFLAATPQAAHAQAIRNRVARAYLARGDGAAALTALGTARDSDDSMETHLIEAAALVLVGRYNEALVACSRCDDRIPTDSSAFDERQQLESAAHAAIGDVTRAEEILLAAVERSRKRERPRQLAMHLSKLGALRFYQGRIADAEPMLREAYALYHSLGERAQEARVLNAIACVCGETGRLSESSDLLRMALDLSRRLGETETMLLLLSNLGQLLATLGQFGEAIQRAEDAARISEERGSRMVLPSLVICAKLYATVGCWDRCLATIARGRATMPEPLYDAQLTMVDAEVAIMTGDYQMADLALSRVDSIIDRIAARDEFVHLELLRARLQAARGETDDAIAHAEASATRAHEIGVAAGIVDTELLLAELVATSQPDVAIYLADTVFAKARDLGLRELWWRVHRVRARASGATGDTTTALAEYDSCVAALKAQCAELPAEIADAYISHPDRACVFVELESLIQR